MDRLTTNWFFDAISAGHSIRETEDQSTLDLMK
jgi:hypothetical protein